MAQGVLKRRLVVHDIKIIRGVVLVRQNKHIAEVNVESEKTS